MTSIIECLDVSGSSFVTLRFKRYKKSFSHRATISRIKEPALLAAQSENVVSARVSIKVLPRRSFDETVEANVVETKTAQRKSA